MHCKILESFGKEILCLSALRYVKCAKNGNKKECNDIYQSKMPSKALQSICNIIVPSPFMHCKDIESFGQVILFLMALWYAKNGNKEECNDICQLKKAL